MAVFDNRNWIPVGFGEVGGSEAVFEAIGRDIAYLPVYCSDGEKITPLSYPFTVDAYGKVDLLIPDTVNRESFKLLRKYPYYHAMTTVTKRLISGKIQAANRPDFSDVVTIHEFTEAQSPARCGFLRKLRNTGIGVIFLLLPDLTTWPNCCSTPRFESFPERNDYRNARAPTSTIPDEPGRPCSTAILSRSLTLPIPITVGPGWISANRFRSAA